MEAADNGDPAASAYAAEAYVQGDADGTASGDYQYQYDNGGYDENNAYYDYYADTTGAAYYEGGAAEYAQDYRQYAYEAGGDPNGADSPTATALPETLWYQDESVLDDGSAALAEEVSELQLIHGAGEYDEAASPVQWDAVDVGGDSPPPQSNDTDSGMHGAVPGSNGGGTTAIVNAVPSATTLAPHNQQQQLDTLEGKPTPSEILQQKKKRQQRIQKHQELLEKREEETKDSSEKATKPSAIGRPGSKTPLARKSSFIAREKAKLQLKMRIARSIARKRMPLQLRVLTETRKHSSPLEKYFGGPVEAVLSDIFWAAAKGDVDRVQFLVHIEGVSAADGALDPWNTPLHWAAKGGSAAVIELLLQHGANPRSIDENGSLPLHLACWAGHIDASLALLRASNVRDLYLPDYDAGLAPLDWAAIRGHAALIKAIDKYEDTLWLPKFIDDLLRGIIKYKIKVFKDPPKLRDKAAVAPDEASGGPVAIEASETAKPALPTAEPAAKESKAPSLIKASAQKTKKTTS